MPRFPVEDASRESLATVRAKLGTVLNTASEVAHSPLVNAMTNVMTDAVARHDTFDAATREAIALAVGNQDGCGYCQSAHTVSAVQAGFSQQQTVNIRETRVDFDSGLGALLSVAREIATNLGEVSDATVERARQAGWSEQQLAELFAHVAVNMSTNYFNHYAGTELDVLAAPGIAS